MGNTLLKDKQMARHSVRSTEHLKSLILLMKVLTLRETKQWSPVCVPEVRCLLGKMHRPSPTGNTITLQLRYYCPQSWLF